VYKLINLIKHHCLAHKLPMIEKALIDNAITDFKYIFKMSTAKKD